MPDTTVSQALVQAMLDAASQAAQAILKVYAQDDLGVEHKADASPLTAADRAAHAAITAVLAATGLPVLSEEGRDIPHAERSCWPRYWLVDPLDGTKEFIKRNGQFTVNIALMDHNRPEYGVVGWPVGGVLFHGGPGRGAFRRRGGQDEAICCRRPDPEGLVVLASLSHGDAQLESWLAQVRVRERMNMGSALKFCALAEGRADAYPRTGPTMEWDTAAGHALLLGAGGSLTLLDGGPFVYNKADLRNPGFLARGLADPLFSGQRAV